MQNSQDVKYSEGEETQHAETIISAYKKILTTNLNLLRRVGEYINSLKPKRIVFWGAGRIFDSIMRYGNIDKKEIVGVIDKYLPEYTREAYGFILKRPPEINLLKPDVIVILSREYADEIEEEIKSLYMLKVDMIKYGAGRIT